MVISVANIESFLKFFCALMVASSADVVHKHSVFMRITSVCASAAVFFALNGVFEATATAIPTGVMSRQVAKESWWNRTSDKILSANSHAMRSDLPASTTVSTAQGIDRIWLRIDAGLGQLRPRSRGLQQALLFSSFEELSDTMRSQFAIDAPSHAFAFFSPLGQGVAVCTEDTPIPFAVRGLSAAIGAEYVRLCCGADLAPVIQSGVLDFLARKDVNGGGGGIGEAGLTVLRSSITASKAPAILELVLMSNDEWQAAIKNDSSGAIQEQAASIVRFLIRANGPTTPARFQQFLRMVAQGVLNLDAFRAVYGLQDERGWAEFDKQWRAFAVKETSTSSETLRERMALIGEGLRVLDREGVIPADFVELSSALKDRNFVSPSEWRPGFSRVSAADASVFTPTDASDAAAGKSPRKSKPPHFEFAAPEKDQANRPPTVVAVAVVGERVKLVWLKTRVEPEAPWVWDIVEGN